VWVCIFLYTYILSIAETAPTEFDHDMLEV